MSYDSLKSVLVKIVYDIEENCESYHCYAYPKTIRSILTANEKSSIASHFMNKSYYGIIHGKIPSKVISDLLDELEGEGKISSVISNGKKMYLSIDNVRSKKSKITSLSQDELDEINSLLDI